MLMGGTSLVRRNTTQHAYTRWLWMIVVLSIISVGWSPVARADLVAEGEALLAFLQGLAAVGPRVSTTWINGTSPCTWLGVGCNTAQDSVETLKLPGVGLYGTIQPGTLGLLSNLQILSLRLNHLSGPLPPDLTNCTHLRKLFLQNNQLSGPIPPFNLAASPALATMDLSFNSFTGSIPTSLSSLTFRILLLQNNSLSGSIPQNLSTSGSLANLNFANNDLSGAIPPALKGFPSSSFAGNPGLCGPPLSACTASSPPSSAPAAGTPAKNKPKNHFKTLEIVLIIVSAIALTLLVVSCCLLCYLSKRMHKQLARSASFTSTSGGGIGAAEKKIDRARMKGTEDSKEEYSSAQEPEHNKLVFFPGGNVGFHLEDLLRASAEVLGKGSFGTAYKAVLEDGAMVVVKRLKEVTVGRKEFERNMDSIGRLRHRNLVPLRAYYFSKEEKLLVHDYYPLGSLSVLLHGPKKTVLDWETRLRIAMGAARGIAHIHGTSSKAVHGNIKSSNVLVYGEYKEARVSDYGLTGLFSPNVAVGRGAMVGYRAPEVVAETRKLTQQSDVYSFGVLLLEILTGKAPWQTSTEEGMELVRWVQSVVREEWTSEVFDKELLKYQHTEEEMVHLLQLGLACVSAASDQRPTMVDVIKTIEEVRPGGLQDEPGISSQEMGGGGGGGGAALGMTSYAEETSNESNPDSTSFPPALQHHHH